MSDWCPGGDSPLTSFLRETSVRVAGPQSSGFPSRLRPGPSRPGSMHDWPGCEAAGCPLQGKDGKAPQRPAPPRLALRRIDTCRSVSGCPRSAGATAASAAACCATAPGVRPVCAGIAMAAGAHACWEAWRTPLLAQPHDPDQAPAPKPPHGPPEGSSSCWNRPYPSGSCFVAQRCVARYPAERYDPLMHAAGQAAEARRRADSPTAAHPNPAELRIEYFERCHAYSSGWRSLA